MSKTVGANETQGKLETTINGEDILSENLSNNISNNISNNGYEKYKPNLQSKITSCLEENGLPTESIIFIYSDSCPHCTKMKPWVEELEGKKYQFLWVSVNGDKIQTISKCLEGIVELRYVPDFICPLTEKNKVGAFTSIEEMENFIEECFR